MVRRLMNSIALLGFGAALLLVPATTRASSIDFNTQTPYTATSGGLDPILFTNFGPSFAYNVSEGNPVGDDGFGGDEWPGEAFQPSLTANLTTIEIALSAVPGFGATDPITVALRADAASGPGGILESFTVPAGAGGPLGSNNPPIVLTSVLNPLLAAGTTYWLTAAAPGTSGYAWNFNSTGDHPSHAISFDNGATWTMFGPGFFTSGAFEVDGVTLPVPEPISLVLVGTGLMGARAARRLIRRKPPAARSVG